MFEFQEVVFAFSLTLLAGLSTVLGVIVINKDKITDNFLAKCLGFSAGVMTYVSFVEIFQKGFNSLSLCKGEKNGYLLTITIFFIGILFMISINKFIPKKLEIDENNLLRLGIISAIAVGIHNFPEGLATFMGALYDIKLGVSVTFAIAVHNIPEGIIVAVPVYAATKSKKKAFYITLLSGLSEPIGALIGFIVFKNIFSELIFGIIFSFIAGVMVFIATNELLPSANNYGDKELVGKSFLLGMIVMSISLYLFM